jgi:hypothetical protein
MVHQRLEFDMPASAAVVFDAFHYQYWRGRWDSLVHATHVLGGAPSPFVGAVTNNGGGGLLRPLAMQTRFISYEPAKVAAAVMVGQSFPFASWAASMGHRGGDEDRSLMVYTYRFETSPAWLCWVMEPAVKRVFEWQTRKRFDRMARFLAVHAADVQAWQDRGRPT